MWFLILLDLILWYNNPYKKNVEGEKMSNYKKYIVKSLDDFLEVIQSIQQEEDTLWYRGQEDASYMLIPKVMRNMRAIKDQFGRDLNPHEVNFSNKGELVLFPDYVKMLDLFKKKAEGYLQIEPRDNFEWLFLAQHYGLPTPLLDWSTDPLVALFFAMPKENKSGNIDEVEEIERFLEYGESDGGAAIFVMNPCKYNKEMSMDFSNLKGVVNATRNYTALKGYLHEGDNNLIGPLCIEGTIVDKRLCRQSGNFTIHGRMVWPLDYPDVVKEIIHKIFIPYTRIEKIKEQLKVLNITEKSIYGNEDMKDMISKTIEDDTNIEFLKGIEELANKFSN